MQRWTAEGQKQRLKFLSKKFGFILSETEKILVRFSVRFLSRFGTTIIQKKHTMSKAKTQKPAPPKNPLYPSTTGKPSGRGRGNEPKPSKGKKD